MFYFSFRVIFSGVRKTGVEPVRPVWKTGMLP
jgi:hypothetical protein